MRILVTGAGGFIGHHLVKRLKSDGHFVRGVDIKMPEYEETAADEFFIRDLREFSSCDDVTRPGFDQVYHLAADMGGIGYITAHLATIARNNSLINLHMLEAVRLNCAGRFLYTSSACVYDQDKQTCSAAVGLREEDAWPANPEPGYGLEKLYAEEMCSYYAQDHGLDVRVVRFHNVYGPLGTYDGGKEKSPAALCRKIATAKMSGLSTIEIWGDGEQTRSYMYIDDCIEGLIRLMASGYTQPLNLGTDDLVSINGLSTMIQEIAGVHLGHQRNLTAPQGVRGRNSDNSKLLQVLGWVPSVYLEEGLVSTYKWIEQRIQRGI